MDTTNDTTASGMKQGRAARSARDRLARAVSTAQGQEMRVLEQLPRALPWFGAAVALEALAALIWPPLWVLAALAIGLGALSVAIAFDDEKDGDDNEVKQLITAAVGAVAVLGLAARMLSLLVATVDAGRAAAGTAAGDLPVGIVTRPMADWLTAHTAGLPVTPAAAGVLAASIAGLLWLTAAAFASRGAQAGWALAGLAAAGMAWQGTPEAAHRPIAAGAVAAVWALLSIPALRRPDRRPRPIAVHHCPNSDTE